jgi:hypothetical protein
MGLSLVTLPVRLGTRAVLLATRPGAVASRKALDLLIDAVTPAEPQEPRRPPPRAPAPAHPVPKPPPVRRDPADEPPAPAHVSEEPSLVAESADAEAADGAGAELSVAAPWDGYRRAKADEIIAALPDLTREELALVQLYEGTHRKRRTVLAAVERCLKIASPPN